MGNSTIPHSRKLILFSVCFLLICPLFQSACAQQQNDIVYQLVYEIYKSPSTGGSIIHNRQYLFGNQFHGCLNELLAKFQTAGENHYQYCDNVYINPDYRAKCKQDNEPMKMRHLLRTLNSVINGQARWTDTLMGQAMMLGEQVLPPAKYRQLIDSSIPRMKPQLLCQ
jgi:hypothetical protein